MLAVEIPVRAHLMPLLRHASDGRHVVVRPAAAHEKGDAHPLFLKEIEHPFDDVRPPIDVDHEGDGLFCAAVVHLARGRGDGSGRGQETDRPDDEHDEKEHAVGKGRQGARRELFHASIVCALRPPLCRSFPAAKIGDPGAATKIGLFN